MNFASYEESTGSPVWCLFILLNHYFIFFCVVCLSVCRRYSADLEQLKNGLRVPPSGWKCEKCDLRENLWLNLTDGSILCGRRNYDGSGGNNHAVEHYQTTGYPLAVKLGTITPDSAGTILRYITLSLFFCVSETRL